MQRSQRESLFLRCLVGVLGFVCLGLAGSGVAESVRVEFGFAGSGVGLWEARPSTELHAPVPLESIPTHRYLDLGAQAVPIEDDSEYTPVGPPWSLPTLPQGAPGPHDPEHRYRDQGRQQRSRQSL